MSDKTINAKRAQEMITRGPYHQWLGLEVLGLHDDGIELKAKWREEWVVNPQGGYTHGGILAALVDLTADWAMFSRSGRPFPTIDLRVDYHSAAMKGDLFARGKIIRMGSSVSCCEATITDDNGKLIASGRGTYSTSVKK